MCKFLVLILRHVTLSTPSVCPNTSRQCTQDKTPVQTLGLHGKVTCFGCKLIARINTLLHCLNHQIQVFNCFVPLNMSCNLRNLNHQQIHYPHSLIIIRKTVHAKCAHVNVIYCVYIYNNVTMYIDATVSLASNLIQLTSLWGCWLEVHCSFPLDFLLTNPATLTVVLTLGC